jgi:hypothetical protein
MVLASWSVETRFDMMLSSPRKAVLFRGSFLSLVLVASFSSSFGQQGIPYGLFNVRVDPIPEEDPDDPAPRLTKYRGGVNSISTSANSSWHPLNQLETARQVGARMILSFAGKGKSDYQDESDHFDLEAWKQRVLRFCPTNGDGERECIDILEYVDDGTLAGHYLLDEPHVDDLWGGEDVPYEDLEAAACFSKELWPYLPTMIRSHPGFFAGASEADPEFEWTCLDAAWGQYSERKGDVHEYAQTQIQAARDAGLAVVFGLNVLNSGYWTDPNDPESCESGIPSPDKEGRCSMNGERLTLFGEALMSYPETCAFEMWQKSDSGWTDGPASFQEYFNRPDVDQALMHLISVAEQHAATPCLNGILNDPPDAEPPPVPVQIQVF